MSGLLDFSKNMEATRKQLKLYQKDVAEKAGLTKAAISSYEKGIKFPTLENALKIAEALNTTIDELCGIKSQPAAQTYANVIASLLNVVDTIKAEIDEHTTNIGRYDDPDTLMGYCFCTYNKTICRFMSDWKKILKLYNDGTIDDELYEAWKMKKQQDYSKIPFYKEDGAINDPESDNDLDDDLPF